MESTIKYLSNNKKQFNNTYIGQVINFSLACKLYEKYTNSSEQPGSYHILGKLKSGLDDPPSSQQCPTSEFAPTANFLDTLQTSAFIKIKRHALMTGNAMQ